MVIILTFLLAVKNWRDETNRTNERRSVGQQIVDVKIVEFESLTNEMYRVQSHSSESRSVKGCIRPNVQTIENAPSQSTLECYLLVLIVSLRTGKATNGVTRWLDDQNTSRCMGLNENDSLIRFVQSTIRHS